MTVPSVFASDFRYASLAGVTDVQTVIDKVDDEITVQLPVASRWTDLGSGIYKSPPQDPTGANRYMHVELIRDSATLLSFKVMDRAQGIVYDGSIGLTASCDVKIFTGPYHLVIQFKEGAAYEIARAVMLDPTPFDLAMTPYYVTAHTRRNSGGSPSQNYADDAAVGDLGGASCVRRFVAVSPCPSGGTMTGRTTGGSYVAIPVDCTIQPVSAIYRWGGRLYQFVMVSKDLSPDATITVPLDDGVSGEFLVLGHIPGTTQYDGYIAVRRA